MSLGILAYKNLFEIGTTAVTDENASFPAVRLYDRDIGLLYKANSAPANSYITVDQGAGGTTDVSRLIIPVGHNLNGLVLKLQRSVDNFATPIDVVTWTQGDALQISKSFAQPATTRYWRLNITCAGVTPQMPEIFLSQDVVFSYNPEYGGPIGTQYNVDRWEVEAGLVRKVKKGNPRRVYRYDWAVLADTDKTVLQAWADHLDGLKSFYLCDVAGTWVFCENMGGALKFTPISYGNWSTSFDFQEVLAS